MRVDFFIFAFYLLLHLCFCFFFFFFFSLSFGSKSKKPQSIAEVLAETLPKKGTVQTSKTGHSSQNRTVRPQFARIPAFFPIERFLKLKNCKTERFVAFSVGPYGLVQVSKPCLKPHSFGIFVHFQWNWRY